MKLGTMLVYDCVDARCIGAISFVIFAALRKLLFTSLSRVSSDTGAAETCFLWITHFFTSCTVQTRVGHTTLVSATVLSLGIQFTTLYINTLVRILEIFHTYTA